MRVKEAFSLFLRKLWSGKVVFYYQCYDEKGSRSSGLSTGQVTKTTARAYCMRLYRDGGLFPVKQHIPTFGEYSQGWWDWDACEYLRNQKGRKDITKSYADNCRAMVKNQILPFFGKTPLDKITPNDINQWLLGFKERAFTNGNGKEIKKSYKNTYANTSLCEIRANLVFNRLVREPQKMVKKKDG